MFVFQKQEYPESFLFTCTLVLVSHHLDHSRFQVFPGHDTLFKHNPFRKGFNSAEKQLTHRAEYFTKFWTSQNVIACSDKNIVFLECLLGEEFSTTEVKLKSQHTEQGQQNKALHARSNKRCYSTKKKENSGERIKVDNREQAIKFSTMPSLIPSKPDWQAAYFSVWKS